MKSLRAQLETGSLGPAIIQGVGLSVLSRNEEIQHRDESVPNGGCAVLVADKVLWGYAKVGPSPAT